MLNRLLVEIFGSCPTSHLVKQMPEMDVLVWCARHRGHWGNHYGRSAIFGLKYRWGRT